MEKKCLWGIIDFLRDDINCHIDAITDLNDCIDKLQADNNSFHEQYDKIEKLQADNKRNVDKFEMRVETLKNEVEEGRAENKRLMSQVSSNSGNSSSAHTISKEINDYMHHNPDCKGVRLFILPRDEFNDGEYDSTIYWEDGIE